MERKALYDSEHLFLYLNLDYNTTVLKYLNIKTTIIYKIISFCPSSYFQSEGLFKNGSKVWKKHFYTQFIHVLVFVPPSLVTVQEK